MRADLQAMQRAGIKRSRFRATFFGVSPRGNIVLHDIQSPFGISRHGWIRFSDWPTSLLPLDSEIEFSAGIRQYGRKDGSEDLQLCQIEDLEVLQCL